MYKGIEIGLKEGLIVTGFSMTVVFIALIIISYTIDIMKFFIEKSKN